MKKLHFSTLQVITHILVWLPLIWFIVQYNTDINPIQAFTQRTGKTALILLVSSLACTPVITLFGLRQVGTIRRALGLYALMYAGIHFFTFIGLDYGFDWSLRENLHSGRLKRPAHPGCIGSDFLPILAKAAGQELETPAQTGLSCQRFGHSALWLGEER